MKTDRKRVGKLACFDNQTRAREPYDVGDRSPTLQAACGEGGNNVPFIVYKEKISHKKVRPFGKG